MTSFVDHRLIWRKRFSTAALALLCLTHLFACQSIEKKNQALMAAQNRLIADPQDKRALADIVYVLRFDSSIVARGNAASALGTVAERHAALIKDVAVPALIDALDRDTIGVKDAAARSLVKFGPFAKNATPVLIKSLTPSDTSVAWFSAEALGNIGEEASEAVPALVKVIEDTQATCSDDSAHICHYAVTALGEIGMAARRAIPQLELMLNSKNLYFKARLAVAIMRIEPANQKAIGALEVLIKERNVQVRRVTMWSLAEIGIAARPARKLIQAAEADADESVRLAAVKLSKEIG
jgi:HEAT repeat protein